MSTNLVPLPEHDKLKHGELICVGTGLRLAGQLTPITKSTIENADIVLGAVASHLTRHWLGQVAKEFVCLLEYYGEGGGKGKSRQTTYEQMVDRILIEVRAGKTVCAAFYGHPGVFACISHRAICQAKKEGYPAHMLPGISAEDCLVADLGIDPGATGIQSMEATQFLVNHRRIDTSALLVLWQVGIVGDLSLKRFDTCVAHLQLLVDKLTRDYAPNHQVILYQAATSALEDTRMDTINLSDLPQMVLSQATTLVIPAATKLAPDHEFVEKLQRLNQCN
jgi:precorrin-3B methylase